jgi:hypothetical protein
MAHPIRLSLFLLLAGPLAVPAQDTTYVAEGARVRAVDTRGVLATGELLWIRGDTLALLDLHRDTARTLVMEPWIRLDVFDGQGPAVGRSAVIGALLGGVVAVALATAAGADCGDDSFGSCSPGESSATAGILGIAAGGLVGIGIGFIPRDRWRRVNRPFATERRP